MENKQHTTAEATTSRKATVQEEAEIVAYEEAMAAHLANTTMATTPAT